MTKQNKDELIRTGAEYLLRGYSVIPVIGKKPCIEWKSFQEKAMTVIEFQNLFETYKPTGIAIITGKISNIVVVDVDDKALLPKLNIPMTPMVETSRGYHYYFKYTDRASSQQLQSMDIKSDGGYIIAPPSRHESGITYKWLINLDEIPMADLPEQFISNEIRSIEKILSWKHTLKGVHAGERNITATKIAGKLMNIIPEQYWGDWVLPTLRLWNKENRPPMDVSEVDKVYESIKKIQLSKKKIRRKKVSKFSR